MLVVLAAQVLAELAGSIILLDSRAVSESIGDGAIVESYPDEVPGSSDLLSLLQAANISANAATKINCFMVF